MLARRISKLAGFRIHISQCQIRRGIRLLTTSSLPSYPCLLLHMDDVVGGDSPGDGSVERVVNFNYYDLVKKRRVSMEEQRIPESIHLSRNIGSSLPKSARKVISLPPLVPLPYSLDPSESTPLTELVRNVSLSSSPDQEDCIAAIKFWGSCISFCRRSPSDDDSSWSWSHINSLPFAFKASSLIYSNTASIFYITPSTAVRSDHSRNFEQYEHKDKHGFPLVAYFMQLGPFEPPGKLSDSELKLLLGCSGGDSRFLVETPSGDSRFLVETPSGDIFTIMRSQIHSQSHIPPYPSYHAPDLSKSMATSQVRNVSLSSSPDNPDQECILAVKFWGSFVSYCTIRDGQWRHELSLSSRASKSFVFYSNNDATFYLTPPIDTFFRKDGRNMPEPSFPCLTYYRQFGPLKHPKMGEYEFELLRRCTRSKQLVESPSGDLFIIVKYALQTSKGKPVFPGETRDLDRSEVKTGTRWFMLYMRHPTTRVESYVQDIGDLCIF
ncbi:hypothetical protein ARALYDRAFT_340386 [Arabidopsis lyrata subsp. lyrata]|uniref:Uncharacterized protein n=1 Tax=Arabidopsis lyrata subsp. lyrata TaxID=81972 RepID=D7KZG8_ARALL|nr:hypothetical protein ARALYDRAFT_340386 [Arabidopsis lyrata subsp. lyrata]